MVDYPYIAVRMIPGVVGRSYLDPSSTEEEALRKARKISNEHGLRTTVVMSATRRLAVEPGDVIPLQVKGKKGESEEHEKEGILHGRREN
jgi:hypothetical protein